jgi:hypothetical protein
MNKRHKCTGEGADLEDALQQALAAGVGLLVVQVGRQLPMLEGQQHLDQACQAARQASLMCKAPAVVQTEVHRSAGLLECRQVLGNA